MYLLQFVMFSFIVYSFSTQKECTDWYVVNDSVMGGVSTSSVKKTKSNTLLFSGDMSMDNNGGFASMRSRPRVLSEKAFSTIKLRVKSDGQVYKFRLRTNKRFDGVAYSTNFQTKANKWVEVELPLEDFLPTFRGYVITDYPELIPTDIQQLGVLIADKQEGEFAIELDWIKFE